MKNVQRLSPCGRVKSQVNGERKIRLLRNKDEQIVCSRSERKWLLINSVYRVASINKHMAIYIVIPSFQVSPETSISLGAEATIDYSGDMQVDYCSANKELYYICMADEEEDE